MRDKCNICNDAKAVGAFVLNPHGQKSYAIRYCREHRWQARRKTDQQAMDLREGLHIEVTIEQVEGTSERVDK